MADNAIVCKTVNKGILTATGVLLGMVSIISPGAAFDLVLAVAVAFIIYRFSDSTEKHFLVKLFVFGLLLRIFLLLVVQYILVLNNMWFVSVFGGQMTYLYPDGGYYTMRSWGITQHIQGAKVNPLVLERLYGNYGYSFHLYLMAFFYYLVGFSPVSIIFINCLFSVSTGVIYYFIAKDVSDNTSARIVAIIIIFLPSSTILSITNLKDPIAIFLIGLALLAFVKWIRAGKIRYPLLFLAALFAQTLIRPKFMLLECGIALWACFFYIYLRQKSKLFYIFLGIIFVAVIAWPSISHNLAMGKQLLIQYNRGVNNSGGFRYRIYDDCVYSDCAKSVSNLELAKATLRGCVHFFLEPFPWKIRSTLSLAAFPHMVVWYALLPFSAVGFFVQLKRNKEITFALLAFLLFMGTIFAMTGGNIGTDFRMRDMLSPLIILFSAVGLRYVFRVRK